MNKKITKTALEEAIHKKAEERYMSEVQALENSVKNSPFSQARLKNKHYIDGGMELSPLVDGTPYEFEEDFLKHILQNYSEFKKKKIAEYEQEETDQLLDSIKSLGEFIEDNQR